MDRTTEIGSRRRALPKPWMPTRAARTRTRAQEGARTRTTSAAPGGQPPRREESAGHVPRSPPDQLGFGRDFDGLVADRQIRGTGAACDVVQARLKGRL